MNSDEVGKIIGKPAKDLYGRYVGFVVGFSVDNAKNVKTIGIDEGNGQFREYPITRVMMNDNVLLIIPSWKMRSEGLDRDMDVVGRRLEVLGELQREGSIPQHIFDEMSSEYSQQLKHLEVSFSDLSSEMTSRAKELDSQIQCVDRFLVALKIHHKSGEIDEDTFRIANDYSSALRTKNIQEKEELVRAMAKADEPSGTKPMTVALSDKEVTTR